MIIVDEHNCSYLGLSQELGSVLGDVVEGQAGETVLPARAGGKRGAGLDPEGRQLGILVVGGESRVHKALLCVGLLPALRAVAGVYAEPVPTDSASSLPDALMAPRPTGGT